MINDRMISEILINDTYVRNIKSIIKKDFENENDEYKQKTEPFIVESIIKTKDFLNGFFNNYINLESGIIPDNCRYVRTFPDNSKIFVLEDEPKLRTVSFNFDPTTMLEILKQNGKYDVFNLSNFKSNIPFKLTLSIPYVVYILFFRFTGECDLSLFFRLAPISSMDDYLLEPCLPNISEQYKVCLGDIQRHDFNNRNQKIRSIIDSFWFNSFNHDYFSHCERYSEVPELSDLFTYAYNSKNDPMFIFSTKWFNTNLTLNKIIQIKNENRNANDFNCIFKHIQSSIGETLNCEIDQESTSIESRFLSDSVCLSNNSIISVGDEIKLNNTKYYIKSFKYDHFRNLKFSVLEDENENIVDAEINDIFLKQIQEQFSNKELKSIIIGEEELKEGDLVYFNSTEEIKIIEKIIQTKDGMKHIKIGRTFYLEGSFLNKTLHKFKGELEFGGIKLVKNTEYVLCNITHYEKQIYFTYFKTTFIDYFLKDGRIMLEFNSNEPEFLPLADSKKYKIIDKNLLKSIPEIFRINDQIITKKINYVDKTGICLDERFGTATDLKSRSFLYDQINGLKYFTDFCNNKKQELNIKSFDFDINYKIGDSVIYINWDEPETMLKIQTITDFIIDNKYFKLTLVDSSGNLTNVSLINLENGEGDFISIRHACDQINEMKAGMILKPTVKGIQDFPMKDNFEIKAFIIDSKYPLVLFSNGRTLYFKDMMNNFVIVNNKRALKPPAEFNLNINPQDGDIFLYYYDLIQLVYSKVQNRMFNYMLSTSGSYSCRISSIDSYLKTISKSKIKNKRGLLMPRIGNKKIKNIKVNEGHPSLFSEICISNKDLGYGIRQDLSFLENNSEANENGDIT
jgi:hypothetical protein